jgi:hypothetical protein
MIHDMGKLSLVLCISFAVIALLGVIFIYLIIKNKSLENDGIEKIIELGKWYVASVAITLSASIISDGFKERDQDVKEMQVFDKYVETILIACEQDKNGLEKRKLLSEYFAAVSPDGPIKESWKEYLVVVNKHTEEAMRDAVERKKIQLIQQKTPEDIAKLEAIDKRDYARNASLVTQSTNPRVFIQIGNESQRSEMMSLQNKLTQFGFLVPGIENVGNDKLPTNPSVRYFYDEDEENAKIVTEQLKSAGYTKATPTRVRGMKPRIGTLEIWLSKG